MCRYRRQGYDGLKDGDWEEFKRKFRVETNATGWAFERVREASHEKKKVAEAETGCLSIVQGIMLKSTDFLRRIIASAGGQGGVTLSYVCPHCNCFALKDYRR